MKVTQATHKKMGGGGGGADRIIINSFLNKVRSIQEDITSTKQECQEKGIIRKKEHVCAD